MKRVGGFTNGSFWIWGKLSEVYPDITFDWDVYEKGNCYDIPAPLDLIDSLLAERLPVFVLVDFSPGGERQDHWVLIKGKEGDYIINDPWTGEEYFFTAKYGDPSRYIFAIRVYRGKVEYEPSCEDKLKDKIVENEVQAGQILEQSVVVGELEAELTKNEDLLATEKKLKTEARQERDIAISQKDTAESKVEGLEKGITTRDEEIAGLREALKASQQQIIKNLSIWQFIKLKYLDGEQK